MKNKIAVVTGGANGIGKCITEEFRKIGVTVIVIDIAPGDHYVGDLSDKSVLEAFTQSVIRDYGHIDYLINNALPLMKGIDECSYEEFEYALKVGVSIGFSFPKEPSFLPFHLLYAKSAEKVTVNHNNSSLPASGVMYRLKFPPHYPNR